MERLLLVVVSGQTHVDPLAAMLHLAHRFVVHKRHDRAMVRPHVVHCDEHYLTADVRWVALHVHVVQFHVLRILLARMLSIGPNSSLALLPYLTLQQRWLSPLLVACYYS